MRDDAIADLFSSIGSVTIRRLFGGKGIYHEGLIVALEIDGELLLKADALSQKAFEQSGAHQLIFSGRVGRKPSAMPYWSVPDEALDDPDAMEKWLRLAIESSRRASMAGHK